ncbi:3-deoxy-D-manno-octulosonic acid transferase [Sulfidibacter corallicola]|uniref:3-deoxy-D-manno-octulosonic acid transferase n=1 Tax=Sulfidibacter corallicola TaxID=2818388 RepID=A0A8A4TU97_SULCO|nr:glycosyltransferase N-terminal domain-containing protein [Sulfidibacter corallicola]QTD52698.1 hypothetical protein J3U87_09500 [Sulfidibacter corallicola]
MNATALRFRAFLWAIVYQSLARLVFALLSLALPLIALLRPKVGSWLRARLWPSPISFQPRVWLHAVSLGEAKIAMALLDALPPGSHDDWLVTATTPAGYHHFKQSLGHADRTDRIHFLPWDLPFCYRRLLGRRSWPELLLVETEIWPNLFAGATKAGARVIIVNGRLGPKTLRHRRNPFFRRIFDHLTMVGARGGTDIDRFSQFGLPPERMRVTGNMKFDLKARPLAESELRDWLARDKPTLVFASISHDEVPLLVPQAAALMRRFPELRLLWAPRHLEYLDQHLAALGEALAEAPPVLRSALKDLADPGSKGTDPRVLVLDTFGELASCYPFAKLSLIGGSFNDRGGQNFLESLQAGTPAVMGPSTENFRREVAEALDEAAIRVVAHAAEVAPVLGDMLEDGDGLQAMSRRAQAFLARHRGAIGRTSELLRELKLVD